MIFQFLTFLLGGFTALTLYTTIIELDSWSNSRYKIGWKYMSLLCLFGITFLTLLGINLKEYIFCFSAFGLLLVTCFKSYKKNNKRAIMHYTGAGICAIASLIGDYLIVGTLPTYLLLLLSSIVIEALVLVYIHFANEKIFEPFGFEMNAIIFGENVCRDMLLFSYLSILI